MPQKLLLSWKKSSLHKCRLISRKCIFFLDLKSLIIFQHIYFSTHIFHNICYFISFIYNAIKTIFSAWCLCMCNHSRHREQRHLTANYFGVLSAFYSKRMKQYYEILKTFLKVSISQVCPSRRESETVSINKRIKTFPQSY